MEKNKGSRGRSAVTTILVFLGLLCIGTALIFFGSRNDAVSVARSLKAGVLTADEVNVAFENVGGRLVWRDIEESQRVKKGEKLMVIDSTDIDISIRRTKALISQQRAALAQEERDIEISTLSTDLEEKSSWRAIEELQAALVSARAAQKVARTEFARAEKLVKTGGVSQSVYDSAVNQLTAANSQVTETERQIASRTIGASADDMKRLEKTGSAEGMSLTAIANARETIKNRANQVASLRAQVEQSEADLAQLEVNHGRLTLTAPEDGKILKILYEAGEIIPSGAAAVLLETDRKYFDIYVSEELVAGYQPGAEVTARAIALGRDVRGRVRFANSTESFADLRSTRERGQADLTSYQVRIYVEPGDGLLTGMTLEVKDAGRR